MYSWRVWIFFFAELKNNGYNFHVNSHDEACQRRRIVQSETKSICGKIIIM